MDNTTTIALSRLTAQSRAIDVTATNIANAATPGYRAQRVLFSDWLQKEPAGSERSLAYTQDRATYQVRDAGAYTHTGNPLDLAIGNGDAWFQVQTPSGVKLTRAGHFSLDDKGTVVDSEGDALLDRNGKPLQVATTDSVLTVAGDGTLSSENGQIGTIGLVSPNNPATLLPEGSRLYATADGTAPVAAPRLTQGAVEESNVQPITELNRMTDTLREFQFVTQFVQAESDRQQSAIDKIVQKGG